MRPEKILQEIDTGRVVADFGTNLMGGLRLEIIGLVAWAKVQVTMSEEMPTLSPTRYCIQCALEITIE